MLLNERPWNFHWLFTAMNISRFQELKILKKSTDTRTVGMADMNTHLQESLLKPFIEHISCCVHVEEW